MLATIIFDKKCVNWSSNSLCNGMFIRNQINYMYDHIRLRGYMYLNEVYDLFGAGWDPHDNSNDCLFYDESNFTFTCSLHKLNDTDYKINIFYQL